MRARWAETHGKQDAEQAVAISRKASCEGNSRVVNSRSPRCAVRQISLTAASHIPIDIFKYKDVNIYSFTDINRLANVQSLHGVFLLRKCDKAPVED